MSDVSIIIPVYCTTDESLTWLEECIQSALQQDCKIIMVDDGSIVNTNKIYKKYKRYITYRLMEHKGVSNARNVAASIADTSLLFPLDCDDRLVPGAVNELLKHWDGSTPVYPDVRKFGIEDVPHYILLDFMCEHILNHVGFTSVNVLHSKKQWQTLGGWNESLDFYEDGEYNARLFSTWCGKHVRLPLVEYRMHEAQRTKTYKDRSAAYAKKILNMIRRYDMACKSCGGKRANIVQTPAAQAPVVTSKSMDVNLLPGELDGRILVQYVGGKGRGKHYYRGFVTKNPYKVTYGDYTYVDPRDAKNSTDTMNNSLFIKVDRIIPQPVTKAPVQKEDPIVKEEPIVIENTDSSIRTAKKSINRVPVLDEYEENLPDIHNMSLKEVINMDPVPETVLEQLLDIEKSGKNRSKIISILQRRLNA